MAIDPTYNCIPSHNPEGDYVPRVELPQWFDPSNSKVTFIAVHASHFYPGGPIVDRPSLPVTYGKSKQQKIDMLLRFDQQDPGQIHDYLLYLAWPGMQTQDIFYVEHRQVESWLHKLGHVPPHVQARITELEQQMDGLRNQVARNARQRGTLSRSMMELRRQDRNAHQGIARCQRAMDDLKKGATEGASRVHATFPNWSDGYHEEDDWSDDNRF